MWESKKTGVGKWRLTVAGLLFLFGLWFFVIPEEKRGQVINLTILLP